MKISGIDFPQLLADALRDQRLVIFAGAGVSIPQPAGLPTFRKLAEAVASGTGEELEVGEPEDRFLGRLHHKGQQVHLQAAQELRKNSPKPTGLHRDLLALYPRLGPLRLVTTNFDTLFEEAARESTGVQPEVFPAPALPLGREFHGIVHVHGTIDKPHDMVLTDADFGRAYLTEGWARRFLVDLFRSFTVLFVGYGHSDTVMNYLARALPVEQTQRRFVLTEESDGNRWQILGIEPVYFNKASSDDYSALYTGVGGLSKYFKRGILDWETIVIDIARNAPSLDEEASDLIGEALSDPARTRFFTRAASHVDWIQWLDQKGHLHSLFGENPSPALEEQQRSLGFWLTRTFAKTHSDEMFNLIAKHRMRLHQEFWDILGGTFASQGDTPWEPQTLERWISLLLATAPLQPNSHVLLWLGERCIEEGLTDSLLDVFRMMSSTKLLIQERPAIFKDPSAPSTTAEVAQVHEHYELNELWERGLKPNLDKTAEPLLDQLVDSFTARHRTLSVWQATGSSWDSDSFRRSAIEPHDQDAYPESIDVLIDAARDSLEHLVSEQPDIAAAWCDRRVRADAPILRRLALHTLALRSDLTPEKKINWVLDRVGLHDEPSHREIFQAMKNIYPSATQEQRNSIIEEVFKFALPDQEGEDTERLSAYAHFNWLSWLHDSDTDCDLVKRCIEQILERYPDFRPRKWADFTHYSTGGFVEQRSPWSTDELLSNPADQWVEQLLTFRGTGTFDENLVREDRAGLARAVEDAATNDFDWGMDLADALAQSGTWDSDLWRPLANSWARRTEENEQRRILERLRPTELHEAHARPVAETLSALIRNGGMSYASGLLSEANQITVALWDNLGENEPVIQMEDWHGRAINHTGGILTRYWLNSLSSWFNQQDPRPTRISGQYSELLERIVAAQTAAGRLGRSVIAQETAFVMAVDEDWAKEHLVPLFDSEDIEDRQAVWDGLLCGRLSPTAADALRCAFSRAVSDMDELFKREGRTRIREQFISTFTAMVAYFVDEPLSSWIPKFFSRAGEEDRRQFAWDLGNIIDDMENDTLQELWQRWLKAYWENRLHGTPAPLDSTEAGAMLDWLPDIRCLYPEAVDLAIKMQNLQLDHSLIVHQLNEGEMWERYPQATAELLIYLADSNSTPWVWYDGRDLIEKLITQGLPEDMNTALAGILAKLGL